MNTLEKLTALNKPRWDLSQSFVAWTNRWEENVGLKLNTLQIISKEYIPLGALFIQSTLYKGETDNQVVYLKQANGVISVGIGDTEIAAGNSMKIIGIFQHWPITVECILKNLKWTLKEEYYDFSY